MFRVKICGLTDPRDARLIQAGGADAIGLNFYEKSRRFVSADRALAILAELPKSVQRVGVFVNATDDEVCRMYDHLQLDLIQLHGDEPPEYLLSLGGRPVVRAFRLGPAGVAPINEYVDQCRALDVVPHALLIDAHQPGVYGGTGVIADWDLLARQRSELNQLPLILAGGLRTENVAEAIAKVQPQAVDTCSGVESPSGLKSAELVNSFVAAASAVLR
jgi:phosphoribosylanthranilate isomerase